MVFVLPGVAIGLSILLLVRAREPLWLVMPLHLLSFGVVALVCHGELARDRPAAGELTTFYLLVAVGGALGGFVTGILVPAVFETLPEYPLAIVAACLCLPKKAPRVPPSKYVRWLDVALPLAVGLLVLAALALVSLGGVEYEGAGKSFAFGLGAGIALNFVRRPLRFGLAVGAIVLAGSVPLLEEGIELRQDRSFFGVIRVERSEDGRLNEEIHGTTTHGAQLLDPAQRRIPLTYFHPTGPAGQIMSAAHSRRTAIIGLGTGSLACYSRPGDHWTFYELDPTVERIARDPRLFTYLRDCDGDFDVVRGDARLVARARPDGRVRAPGRRRFLLGRHPHPSAHARGRPPVPQQAATRWRAGLPHLQPLPRPRAGARRGRPQRAADMPRPERAETAQHAAREAAVALGGDGRAPR